MEKNEYMGLSVTEAIKMAERKKERYRIVHRDGENYVFTADFNAERINFSIDKGIITDAKYG